MIKTKNLLVILIPAILIAAFALFVRVIQYEPLFPEIDGSEKIAAEKTGLITIPIYPEDPIMGNKKALKYFEEKSYEEISDILRIPINTVGTLINRAKQKIVN